MKKKLFSILLSLAMVVTMIPMMTGVAFADATPIPSSNTTWELSSDGKTLTIGGTGAMPDFSDPDDQPWSSYNNSITTVIIESGVTTIGINAFNECGKIENVTIPSSVTSIGDCAFMECYKLKSLTIPSSVTSIGEFAFAYSGLTSLTVKAENPPILGELAFEDCSEVKIQVPVASVDKYKTAWGDYDVQAMPPAGTEDDPWLIGTEGHESDVKAWLTENGTEPGTYTLTISGTGMMKDFSDDISPWYSDYYNTITSAMVSCGITNLGKGLFYGLEELNNVEIPNSITAIGSGAFGGCSNLESITIPEGVTSIDDCVFENCIKLKSITIPEGVTSIGETAFWGCEKLPSVTIPSSVTDIGEGAFYGCNELKSVTIKATQPPTFGGSGAFEGDDLTICVPAESFEDYNKDEWRCYIPDTAEIKRAYTVNVTPTENGTVSVNRDWIPEDEGNKTVTITTTPANGYELDKLTVKTVSGKDVSVEKNQFTVTNESVTISATFKVKSNPTPSTGDSSDIFFYGLTTLLALIGAGFVYGLRRKEEK